MSKEILHNKSNIHDGFCHQEHIPDPWVYTRKLGYPEIMFNRNSKQLTGLADSDLLFVKNASEMWYHEKRDEDCFICNKSSMVNIFFRRRHAEKDFEPIENSNTRAVLFECYRLRDYCALGSTSPVILGSCTEWRPVKMMAAIYHTVLKLTKQMAKNPSRGAQATL